MIASFMAAVAIGIPAAPRTARASNPLVGIWRSDEARTHRDIRKRGAKLAPRLKELFLEPGFFGRMAYAFTETRAIIAHDGECMRPFSYHYQRVEKRRVRVLVFQPNTENFIFELELRRDELRSPMGGELNDRIGGLVEVFRRSSLEEVAPCIEEWLEKREAEEELPAESVRISGPDDAAELAARLANDKCEQEYGLRPFAASDGPIELVRGRWVWGRVDALGPQGYSAVVSFERNGRLPLVRIYAVADDSFDPRDYFFDSIERPDGSYVEPPKKRLEPNRKFWKGNDKLVPP
jgi:hypothetical protein